MPTDLSIQLGSLQLRSPIIVGSSPLTLDEIQRIALVSNGVGAMVLPSFPTRSDGEPECSVTGDFDNYLRQIEKVSTQNPIPVFASFAGMAEPDCTDWPKRAESAGAAAIEISLHHHVTNETDPRRIEDSIVRLAETISHQIEVPLFLKLTPNFTSISELARRLNSHVQGLIMFGRSPVIDMELDSLQLSMRWGLTPPGSIVQTIEPLMRTRNEYPKMPLIACGGISTSMDLIKALICGASGAMVTSEIYRSGAAVICQLREGLARYMSDHGVGSISELHSLCPPLTEFRPQIETAVDFSEATSTDPATGSKVPGDRFGHPIV